MIQKKLKKQKNLPLLMFFLITNGFFFSYGFLSYHYKIYPYNLVVKIHSSLSSHMVEEYEYDVSESLIEIENEDDIFKKRDRIIKYIWKDDEFPILKMPKVTEDISDERYFNLQNLKQIDKLTVDMDYNISSIMYHFQSSNPNNELIIYHQGHRGDFIQGKDIIQEFLDNGYDVIAISMPLLGMNNQPEIELERFGKVKFSSHDHFKLLDNDNFSSIKFFIEPVIVAVNYAQKSNFNDIYMTGISGGGWTTVVSSAIEPRISKSYPVAGSYPIFLRSSKYGESFGDYEQTEIGLYRIANYLELYILGSYGDNRKQVQILNIYDNCCFRGHKYASYEDIIYKKMSRLGKGKFAIFADDSHHEHKISKKALKFIINDLKNDLKLK